jgi:2-polyprenyl-3-methyl-5-hydroxy-6-metoxy-1,4-benzoquinol methylase
MKNIAASLALCACIWAQPSEYNQLYSSGSAVYTREPNALLVEAVRNRKPGRALDVGMGQGRNALFLARNGWDVTGFDSADEGIRQAKAQASRLGLKLTAQVNTFEAFEFGLESWDLIVLTYEPTKAIAPKVTRALRPGGIVVVEDRHLDTRRVWPAGTFQDNELLSLFAGLRVLRYEDVWALPDWSAKKVAERLVRLVAEKPMPRLSGCAWEGKEVGVGSGACWEGLLLRCEANGWRITREQCTP